MIDFAFLLKDSLGLSHSDISELKKCEWLSVVESEDEINSEVMVANFDGALIFPKQIEWFMKNFKLDSKSKVKYLKNIYESSITLLSGEKESLDNVAIIGRNEISDKLSQRLDEEKIKHSIFNPKDIIKVYGQRGFFGFELASTQVNFSQVIVCSKDVAKIDGFKFVNDFSSEDELVDSIKQDFELYFFKKHIAYDPNICSYHHRSIFKDEHKTLLSHPCVDVCPHNAINNIDSLKELFFNPLICNGCNLCINVCKSGALESLEYSPQNLDSISKLYDGESVLLIDENSLDEIEINTQISPLVLKNLNVLSFANLLALIQESGHSLTIYSKDLKIQNDIDFINEIFNAVFGKNAILVLENLEEVNKADVTKFPTYKFFFNQETTREHFSSRMKFLIKDNDFGKINSKIPYSEVMIDKEACTLCMSCVSACKPHSLFGGNGSFEILYNHSLCTNCHSCEIVCPHNAISFGESSISLSPSFFTPIQKAYDDPFKCVVCDKVFAPKKSVEKIKNILSKSNMNQKQIKTLSCCEDCKVKVMFGGA